MADIHFLRPDAARASQADDAMHLHLGTKLTAQAERLAEQAPDVADKLTGLATLLASDRRMPSIAFALCDRLAAVTTVEEARALAVGLAGLPPRTLRRPLLIAGAPDAAPLLAMLAEDIDPSLRKSPVPAAEASAFAVRLAQASVLMGAHLPELRAESDILFQEIMLGHTEPDAVARTGCGPHDRYWGLLMMNPGQELTPLAIIETFARETAQALLCGLTIDDRAADTSDLALPGTDGPFRATLAAARVAWAMDQIADSREASDADREAASEAARRAHDDFQARLATLRTDGAPTARAEATEALLADAEAWISV